MELVETFKILKMVRNLIQEIDNYSDKYQFSFQFWGDGNNNVFIMKDDIDLYSSGGFSSIQEVLIDALQYIYKINRVPYENRVC
jgi:hypothetical protein